MLSQKREGSQGKEWDQGPRGREAARGQAGGRVESGMEKCPGTGGGHIPGQWRPGCSEQSAEGSLAEKGVVDMRAPSEGDQRWCVLPQCTAHSGLYFYPQTSLRPIC